MTTVAALEMNDITKGFPGVRALEAVSFDCRPGEVHAICGENGAGKSTLMKILGGIYRPDAGTLRIGGRAVAFAHPVDARRAGIGIIHQELSLLPDRSVAENIYLGLEPVRRGVLDRAAMRAGATPAAREARIGHPDRGQGRRPLGRGTADRRDRQGPRPRSRDPGHGRADGRPRRHRREPPPRPRAAPAGPGCRARLRLPPLARNRRDLRPGHRPQGWPQGRDGSARPRCRRSAWCA